MGISAGIGLLGVLTFFAWRHRRRRMLELPQTGVETKYPYQDVKGLHEATTTDRGAKELNGDGGRAELRA